MKEPSGESNGDPVLADVDAPQRSHVPVHYSPRTGRSIVIFAIVAAVVLAGIFLAVHYAQQRNDESEEQAVRDAANAPVSLDVIHVQLAATEKVIELPGNARSFYETTVFARTSGYLKKWLVDIGDEVKEGQTLATIETPELDDQLNEAKAKLDELKSEAKVADASLQLAQVTYNRWKSAAKEEKGVVSEQELDQTKSQQEASLAKLAAANSSVNLGQAEVQRLETLEKFKTVVAPYDGVITARHIDLGDLVTAGSTTNTTPLFTVSQANQIRVFVDVPQPAVPDIHVGMKAYAQSREWGNRKFEGIVDRTASALDPHSRTLRVEVLVPNPRREHAPGIYQRDLAPGMYMRVTFQTQRSSPPVRIPPAALEFGPRGAQAAVVDAGGKVNFRDIVIGRDLGDAVEIESGLKEGEVVALNVGSQVVDGQKVEPHFTDAPQPVPPPQVAAE